MGRYVNSHPLIFVALAVGSVIVVLNILLLITSF